MSGPVVEDAAPVASGFVAWVVIGATTALWLGHLVGMAVLAEAECAGTGAWVLHAFTVALLAPTLWLTELARRRRVGTEGQVFVARFAVWVGVVNAFAIVAEWLPIFLLTACGS